MANSRTSAYGQFRTFVALGNLPLNVWNDVVGNRQRIAVQYLLINREKLGVTVMLPTARILLIFSALLIASCASGPSGMGFDSALGEWETKFVNLSGIIATPRMTIIDESKATYEYQEGRILFYAVDDQGKWEGYWVERGAKTCTESKDGSNFWGMVSFQFNDTYTNFTGYWNLCGKGIKRPWSGNRSRALEKN